MTPVFALSLVAIISLVVSILFYLVQHVRRYDEAEKTQTIMDDSAAELTIDTLAGIDRKKVA
jgi:hypothetical protein